MGNFELSPKSFSYDLIILFPEKAEIHKRLYAKKHETSHVKNFSSQDCLSKRVPSDHRFVNFKQIKIYYLLLTLKSISFSSLLRLS